MKELVWNARLQPTAEYSVEQMETETSQSPTGTVQSFSPTWEMLQVTSFSSIATSYLSLFIQWYPPFTIRTYNNAGNNGPTIIHGCQMGAMPATFPNDIEGWSAVAIGTILDATVSLTLGAMVRFLGHHCAPRRRTSARQASYRRQPDESRTRSDSGLSTLSSIHNKSQRSSI